MTSLEIIKDELAKMPESPATKALSVAVTQLQAIYDESYHKHHNAETNVNMWPAWAREEAYNGVKQIANILSGGTVASLNEDKK